MTVLSQQPERENSDNSCVRICVGVATRNRKIMLRSLFASFRDMHLKSGMEVIFAVVENNAVKTLSEDVAEFRNSAIVHYELETRLGIPFARNRVLDISQRENCNFTAFVDDDETVDPLWLFALYDEIAKNSLDIVGGEVRLHPIGRGANIFQKLIWQGVEWRYKRIARRSIIRHRNGTDAKVVLTTNNWLMRNNVLCRFNLRFDEFLGQSGGSDTKFFKSARNQGAKSGWTEKALVFETVPLSRLSVGYQYQRGHDQAIATFRYKYPKATLGMVPFSVVYVAVKITTALAMLFLTLFTQGRSFTTSIRAFGLASGRIHALLGKTSSHYLTVHGE